MKKKKQPKPQKSEKRGEYYDAYEEDKNRIFGREMYSLREKCIKVGVIYEVQSGVVYIEEKQNPTEEGRRERDREMKLNSADFDGWDQRIGNILVFLGFK